MAGHVFKGEKKLYPYGFGGQMVDLVKMNSKDFVCRTTKTIRVLNEGAKSECRPLEEKDNLFLAPLSLE